ncbi:MAG: hypothetical protein ACRC41_05750 [Sarcina sp.]
MILAFSYYFLFLLIIIFYLTNFFRKQLPKKIKLTLRGISILAILRAIYIIVLGYSDNIILPNMAKYIVNLDIIYISIAIITLFYIYWRSDKVKFNNISKLFYIIIGLYGVCIALLQGKFNLDVNFGYYFEMRNQILFKIFYICIFLIFCFIISRLKQNKSSNMTGILFIFILISILIVENFMMIALDNYFNYAIISDIVLMCNIAYGIKSLSYR